MRKITFGVANSFDNYIAREDGSVDWLLWSDEIGSFMGDYWKKIDTILMGRKTFEIALEHGKGANPYPNMKTYVFSKTLGKDSRKDVEIITDDAVEFVRNLKAQDGKEICMMGGGDLAKTLFEADLIDEIGFNVHPILLGSGIRLFHKMNKQINLELIETKKFENGCVLLSYRIK